MGQTITQVVARGLSRAAKAEEKLAKRLDREPPVDERAAARALIGGLWDEMGKAQIDFMLSQGLQPTDRLLDVGCGSLRGGIHFIKYLEPGHYYGLDRSKTILKFAQVELADAGLVDKRPHLLCDDEFNFGRFDTKFDFAFAQSVFSHLPLNIIHRCLVQMGSALKPGGVFYATFLENRGERDHVGTVAFPQPDGPDVLAYPDRDPFHYHVSFFEDIASTTPLKVEYVGDWGSLRGQSMLAFHRV